MTALPLYSVRPDIDFNNNNWSGPDLAGEYIVELYAREFALKTYGLRYVEEYLEPVYELIVQGSPILKIWKNDRANLRSPYRESTRVELRPVWRLEGDDIVIDLEGEYAPLRLHLMFRDGVEVERGFLDVSRDGRSWRADPEAMPEWWIPRRPGRVVHEIVAKPVRFLRVRLESPRGVSGQLVSVRVEALELPVPPA